MTVRYLGGERRDGRDSTYSPRLPPPVTARPGHARQISIECEHGIPVELRRIVGYFRSARAMRQDSSVSSGRSVGFSGRPRTRLSPQLIVESDLGAN